MSPNLASWRHLSPSYFMDMSQHVCTNQLSLLWTTLEICVSKTRFQPELRHASVPSLHCGHVWTITVLFSTL